MLRLITKTKTGFKTYDFNCDKLQSALEDSLSNPPELVGIEIVFTLGSPPRLIGYQDKDKIPAIKAVREHTGWGLKEAKEFVDSVPVLLPQLEPEKLVMLVRDLREAGAVVEG